MITTAELRELLQFSREIRKRVALEMTASLPIPSGHGNTLVGRAFYYARSGMPPREEFDIYPPTWYAEIDWDTGKLITLSPQEPAFFGITGSRFRPFARVSYAQMNLGAANRGLGDVMQRNDSINRLYDRLLPIWKNGQTASRSEAAEFDSLFKSLAEAPLLPVYYRLGAEFFRWLAAAT